MSRFRKSDWLDLGWSQLAVQGPDGVKIDLLCVQARRSKGSFYHHFKDFDAFLSELTELWVQRQTRDLIDKVDLSQPLAPQMEAMVDEVVALDYRFELGLRELSRKVPAVARRVQEVDALRLDFTAQVYERRFGLPKADAVQLATLEYAVLAGLILLDPDMEPARQKALYQTYEELLEARYGRGD